MISNQLVTVTFMRDPDERGWTLRGSLQTDEGGRLAFAVPFRDDVVANIRPDYTAEVKATVAEVKFDPGSRPIIYAGE